jgi:murein DD-endopeptidase MepM/ murein hydrolase activator NlpD
LAESSLTLARRPLYFGRGEASGMKRLCALAALVLLLLPTRLSRWLDVTTPRPAEPLRIVLGTVRRNDTLASALEGLISPAGIHALVQAARPVYDLARLSVGRPFGVALGQDGLLRAFTYRIDELQLLRVSRHDGELSARILERQTRTRTSVVAGTIESSLFTAVARAGEEDQLALDLAEIFAWDVDFNTEIREGDSFRVAVEKEYAGEQLLRYGRILAAEVTVAGRALVALRHEGRGRPDYFDPEGRPLRKAFLRSPLRFTRISSRFATSRLHPILRVRRPHLGVDYAAPIGTPVHAAADGVVAFAGWLGGFGRTVRVRHKNGYETLYGHLSRLDVRPGQRVAQGQRVGAVGRTGLATGPHLDYRMRRDGRFVDPLRIELPPAEPVPADERAVFAVERRSLLTLLAPSSPAWVSPLVAWPAP